MNENPTCLCGIAKAAIQAAVNRAFGGGGKRGSAG